MAAVKNACNSPRKLLMLLGTGMARIEDASHCDRLGSHMGSDVAGRCIQTAMELQRLWLAIARHAPHT